MALLESQGGHCRGQKTVARKVGLSGCLKRNDHVSGRLESDHDVLLGTVADPLVADVCDHGSASEFLCKGNGGHDVGLERVDHNRACWNLAFGLHQGEHEEGLLVSVVDLHAVGCAVVLEKHAPVSVAVGHNAVGGGVLEELLDDRRSVLGLLAAVAFVAFDLCNSAVAVDVVAFLIGRNTCERDSVS